MAAAVVVTAVIGLVATVLVGVLAARDVAPGRVVLVTAGVVEVAALGLLVVAVAGLVGGHRPAELLTFWAYLVVLVLVMPIVVAWGLAERTRWSTAVVGVGTFTVVAMSARIWQLWSVTRA